MRENKKNKWTGSAEDFVEFVRFVEVMEVAFHRQTKKPATRQEIDPVPSFSGQYAIQWKLAYYFETVITEASFPRTLVCNILSGE